MPSTSLIKTTASWLFYAPHFAKPPSKRSALVYINILQLRFNSIDMRPFLPNLWTTLNIHIRNFLMRNLQSAYQFTLVNIWKLVSRLVLNLHQLVYFIINNNNKYSH